LARADLYIYIYVESILGHRFDAELLGEQLAIKIMSDTIGRSLLGPRGQKRALTYGDAEAPGDAAAAATLHAESHLLLNSEAKQKMKHEEDA
jgi:hypothetical protein